MLSQSMLQKFTSKIQKLASNSLKNERTQSPSQQIHNSTQKLNAVKKNFTSQMKKKLRSQQNSNNSSVINIIEQSDENQSNNIQQNNGSHQNSQVINLDENYEKTGHQRINAKLTKLIAVEKQKNLGKANTAFVSTIKKSVGPPVQKQITSTNQNSKPTAPQTTATNRPGFSMPKVAVMNNLIKLSTKISYNELLKQIKYQATLISIAPIRLLLYFCIERTLFNIYQINGIDKMEQKSADFNFLQKQIQIGMVSLLSYIKITQRAMISRILRGLFSRLKIIQVFSQKWLTECFKINKAALQALSMNVDQLIKPQISTNITSNIFIGVNNPQKKIIYKYPTLELQDQINTKQKIEDPQVPHVQQTLFFFKKSFPKNKQNTRRSIQTNKNQLSKNQSRKDQNTNQIEEYQQKQLKIEIKKINLPQNCFVLTNSNNFDEYDVYKPIKPQNIETNDLEIVSRRRGRSQITKNLNEQSKIVQPRQKASLSKQQIIQIIEQYFNDNIDQLANKITKKWQIDPIQIKNLIKQSAQGRSLPNKITSEQTNGKQKQKIQTDGEIIKQIQFKSNQLQKAGVDHKQLVKQIFKILETKNISHEKKEQIMEKWIALKKSKKNYQK